ncbi:hypothetical protein HPB52_021560 [Rhipicephalus sanguineus]|uniref:Uncharacterized protein n=1 Tax=Rhipicephalus sanguineus TaxID=34632 RepID=A0A9D4PCK3_RHISA|nr:hypothetical protein HPB52_021560 [Rhipicephalus sanguineus]
MTTKTAGTNTTDLTTTLIVFQQPREPPKFHGSSWEDAQEWLEKFERKLRICPFGVHCKLGAEFKDTPNTVWNRKAFGNVNTVAGFLGRLSGKIPQLSQLDTPKVLRDLIRKVPELPNVCVGNVRFVPCPYA